MRPPIVVADERPYSADRYGLSSSDGGRRYGSPFGSPAPCLETDAGDDLTQQRTQYATHAPVTASARVPAIPGA